MIVLAIEQCYYMHFDFSANMEYILSFKFKLRLFEYISRS